MSSITLKDVCLDYGVRTGPDSIKKLLANTGARLFKRSCAEHLLVRNSSFRALHNINLSLNDGDRVGLLGKNGAGKSSLLRVIAKVYRPSEGALEIQGKISTFFSRKLGMNIEATGYENIVNLALVNGVSRHRIASIVDEVVKLSELSEFLHFPVRTYSKGMQVKLAFSVATASSADILLIDESIGAGDARFMRKAQSKIEGLIDDCHIMMVASHSSSILKRFCNKAIVLDAGRIVFSGTVDEAITYHEALQLS